MNLMHIKNIINEYLISNWRRDLLNIGLIVGGAIGAIVVIGALVFFTRKH